MGGLGGPRGTPRLGGARRSFNGPGTEETMHRCKMFNRYVLSLSFAVVEYLEGAAETGLVELR